MNLSVKMFTNVSYYSMFIQSIKQFIALVYMTQILCQQNMLLSEMSACVVLCPRGANILNPKASNRKLHEPFGKTVFA